MPSIGTNVAERRGGIESRRGHNEYSARPLAIGVFSLMVGLSTVVVAQQSADLDADRRAIVAKLTADRMLAIANERRIAADEYASLNRRLEGRDRALRAAAGHAAGDAAKLRRIRHERDEIARQRNQLVAAVTDRDQMLAAEVRAYREAVTGIAASPDPRKLKALQRFADGEQREALADLDLIAEANNAARIKAANISAATDRRPTAWLALQAHDNGRVTLDEVVQRYEQLTRLDPGTPWDWIELARLYDQQGRLADATKAAQSAHASLASGVDERDRAAVLGLLGNIVMAAGDLGAARGRFEESLAILRKLARDNPTSAAAQRDVSISLNKLGDVAMAAGDLQSASDHFQESLTIRRTLARATPTSAASQRDLSVALSRLGDVAVAFGDLPVALSHFEESLAIDRKRTRDNPTSAAAKSDLSVSLTKLGDVAVAAGDLQTARGCFEESLTIVRTLARTNPTSADAKRNLSVSLERLGEIAMAAGDLTAARRRLEESLAILRRLARDNPTSAAAQRDFSVGLNRLGDLAVAAGDLRAARDRFYESLTIDRTLARANPASATAQRSLSVSLERLGDVAVAAGDLTVAHGRFEESVRIRRTLARANPTSAEAQRDLIVSLCRLGTVTDSRPLLTEALEIAQRLERSGRLAPRDRRLLEKIHKALESIP
jgi:tetratricopeptide (TPR) repeat protein